jgi:hypothetical protein
VFRANGITLTVNQNACRRPKNDSVNDASNAGPTGLQPSKEIERREGFILCDVKFGSRGRSVRVIKYDTDRQTYIDVLNVNCAVFPYDAAHEKQQVERVRRAMVALAAGFLPG